MYVDRISSALMRASIGVPSSAASATICMRSSCSASSTDLILSGSARFWRMRSIRDAIRIACEARRATCSGFRVGGLPALIARQFVLRRRWTLSTAHACALRAVPIRESACSRCSFAISLRRT